MDPKRMELLAAFSSNLRAERGRAGISQEELAERAGISASSVIDYENSKSLPTLSKAAALASALGCTPNTLMGWPS